MFKKRLVFRFEMDKDKKVTYLIPDLEVFRIKLGKESATHIVIRFWTVSFVCTMFVEPKQIIGG